jgi:E3 ubiquitin-protein ligase BAH
MKFAREYQEFLHKAEFPYDFPKQWINSAISYGQLKKCIKKVERELSSLGLDAETLKHLLQVVDGDQESGLGTKEGRSENVPFKYSLDGNVLRVRVLYFKC